LKKLDEIILYSDGASLGNPGKAGIGVVIYDQDRKLIKEISKFIGITTNNVAEYMALVYGLEEALYLRAKKVSCFLDSELLARQLEGSYKVRDEKLKLFYHQVKYLEHFFNKISFSHLPREKNKEADKLAKEAAKGKRE
jgi:ribonuclease HI